MVNACVLWKVSWGKMWVSQHLVNKCNDKNIKGYQKWLANGQIYGVAVCAWGERGKRGETSYRAAAPEMISISSLVMTAWRVRLKVRVSLSIISADGQETHKTVEKSQVNILIKQLTKKLKNINIVAC